MFDPKKLAAEFVGTAILVFIAVGVATESFGFKLFGTSYAAGVVTTALAFGLVLMALAYAIGPISGAHVNPAVTLGFVAAGRMKATEGIGYLVAQVAGAIAGAAVLWGMLLRHTPLQPQDPGAGRRRLRGRLVGPPQPERRLRRRGRAHLRLRHRDPLRHPQGGHSGGGRAGHRHGPGRGPPDRHSPDRHLGQPGPQPRPGPHRGRHRPQPGLAVPRGPPGRRRRRGGGPPLIAGRTDVVVLDTPTEEPATVS